MAPSKPKQLIIVFYAYNLANWTRHPYSRACIVVLARTFHVCTVICGLGRGTAQQGSRWKIWLRRNKKMDNPSLGELLVWHPFLLHWHPAGGLTRFRINYCSKKRLYTLLDLTARNTVTSHVWNTLPYSHVARNQLFIFHLLYITSQSIKSYVCSYVPPSLIFFSLCVFSFACTSCTYSIPRSIWPPIIQTFPLPPHLTRP